jgi:putative transposase
MSLRLRFAEAASMPGANISALCAEYGISRQTGHKWLRRYRAQGALGLVDQSRRPSSSPTTTADDVVRAVLDLRNRHASWGAQKIARVLVRTLGPEAPAKSTVQRLLRRFGRIRSRRPPVRIWNVEGKPRLEVTAPNDLWTIDFKGWWKARNGQRCEPLTVRDACSRMVLAVRIVTSTKGPIVRRILQRLFEKHGTPRAILIDNGSPWVSPRARAGLTRLSVWLVSLGIRLIRTRAGCPQDNGGHERMHRDLTELQASPARTRHAQQAACDRWLVEFNHVRPHDALGGKTPAEVYVVTERRPPAVRIPIYPDGWIARRVNCDGEISLHGDRVRVSEALVGHLVGLKYEGGLRWRARFFEMDLGVLEVADLADLDTREVQRVLTVNPASTTSLTGVSG